MTVLRSRPRRLACIRQAWMPQEQGTPPDVGTTDVMSGPEFGGGSGWRTLPAGTSPAVDPGVEITFTMPAAVDRQPGGGPHGSASPRGGAELGPLSATPAAKAASPDEPAPQRWSQPGPRAAGTRPDPVAWLIALAAFAAYTTLLGRQVPASGPGIVGSGHLHPVRAAARRSARTRGRHPGPGFNLLGDHFQPIVALVAPFFRLFPTPVTLLVAQALLTAVSVVPVCRPPRHGWGSASAG